MAINTADACRICKTGLTRRLRSMKNLASLGISLALVCAVVGVRSVRPAGVAAQSRATFDVEEATIASIHAAITSGQTTCRGVVQAYIDRAKAYNGVCTALLTSDGADAAPATGYVRAGAPLVFPTKTVKASTILPDLAQYRGLPLDYGRMERTVSDPSVTAQMGMRVGIPNAGQLNALETLNIRGERSVTCKGAFDAHPSTGPLPAGAPSVCEAFRRQPDALERSAELDAQYGARPDLAALPMYCIVTAVKDPYDTKDMRTTANNDVNFAMDAPPFDATVVARLRAKGAIIYAKSVAHEFNGGPGDPGGAATARSNLVPGQQTMGAWAGQSCNPLDGITPFFQIPRIVVPAGTTDVVYEPRYALSPDQRTYISVLAPGTPKSTLAHPMPVALTFFSGQGEEPVLIKVGTAYESATHHRRPPPAFGPVAGHR